MLKEVKDEREHFVKDLERLAQKIRDEPRQPLALFVHVFYEEKALLRFFRQRPGFNRLEAIGGFQCTQTELALRALDSEK